MYSIEINGKPFEISEEGDMPLLWVLRDVLGLTGTKRGCTSGGCGACTVWVNGRPTKSCGLPLHSAASKKNSILTIEGLHPANRSVAVN